MPTDRRALPPASSTTRRAFLLAGGAVLAAGSVRAAVPPGEAETVARVEAYLNGITTLQARFTQIAHDGRLAAGMLYLQRPGKLRFVYDPPARIGLVATDWRLIYYDAGIKQMNVIPVSETPLGFLLDERIRLAGEIAVTDVAHRGNEVALRLIRAKAPDQGSVTIYLSENPMELRRWTVTDPQGLATTIVLENIRRGITLDPELFRWRDPQIFGWPER